jgi:hypothetical protein
MARLNDVQLSFLVGFWCGCEHMRMELQHEMEERIERIRVELQHKVEETIDRLNKATTEKMDAMMAQLVRLRAIESAVDTERDPGTFLN